jgi:GTP cyclohydrolase II
VAQAHTEDERLFSYVDKSIRSRLERDRLLVTLDRDSREVAADDAGAFLSVLGPVPIPRLIGGEDTLLDWYPFVRRTELSAVLDAAREVTDGSTEAFRHLLHSSMSVNSVFAMPALRAAALPLVRIHSCCLTGDVFGSRRCDCGDQLQLALTRLQEAGGGIILYLAQEGRGLGLANKMRTYKLQDAGLDTVDANITLGFDDDERDYGVAVRMLQMLGCSRVILMTNNPAKLDGLTKAGIEIVGRMALETPINADNHRYMAAKAVRAGHQLGHILSSLGEKRGDDMPGLVPETAGTVHEAAGQKR